MKEPTKIQEPIEPKEPIPAELFRVLGIVTDIQKENAISRKETDAMLRELIIIQKENDAMLSAKFQDTDKKFKELNQQIGGISKSNGDFAEEFFYNCFSSMMEVSNIKYNYIDSNKKRKLGKLEGEYDIVMVNSTKIMVIEVKYKLTTDNVIKFYDKQLPRFKQLFQEFKDYTINAGIAAFCFDKYAKEYTHQKGLLLFTQSDNKIKKLSPDNMLLSEF